MEITTKEYTLLFNVVTDTIEKLEEFKTALIIFQQRAAETVISKSNPQKEISPLLDESDISDIRKLESTPSLG